MVSAAERVDCAYIINSTPKYYYLLEPHLALLRRYGNGIQWPIYIGTEEPENPVIKACVEKYGCRIIVLNKAKAEDSFWESRMATVERLPKEIKYILPMQEDFLLERPGICWKEMERLLAAFDENKLLISARISPCPGPKHSDHTFMEGWAVLSDDDYLFTFQATLWKRELYCQYLTRIIEYAKKRYPNIVVGSRQWNQMAVNMNLAENGEGKLIFQEMFQGLTNIGWKRRGAWPNAVYDCPISYRPTAVVKGVLMDWAKELIQREGLTIKN